jgi:hypothetical protein
VHLGDGIKFIEENAVADHGTSTHSVPNGKDSNAIKILVVDVDSSDLRWSLSFSLLSSTILFSFGKQFHINTVSDLMFMVQFWVVLPSCKLCRRCFPRVSKKVPFSWGSPHHQFGRAIVSSQGNGGFTT